MALQIGQAIERGLGRLFSVAGGVLFVVFLIVQLGSSLVTNTIFRYLVADFDLPEVTPGSFSPALPVSSGVATAMLVVFWILSLVATIALVRVLVRGPTDTVPTTAFTRRIGITAVFAAIASILMLIAIYIGLIFLLVPGLFLGVSFMFTIVYVAVEDDGPLEALQNSWILASGNRWRLFGLLLLVAIPFAVLQEILGLLLAGVPNVNWVVSAVVGTLLPLLLLAVIADAYRQLSEEREERLHGGEPAPDGTTWEA